MVAIIIQEKIHQNLMDNKNYFKMYVLVIQQIFEYCYTQLLIDENQLHFLNLQGLRNAITFKLVPYITKILRKPGHISITQIFFWDQKFLKILKSV